MDDSGPKLEVSSIYIKIFAARYNTLLKVASLLAGKDREQAIDLVHDALLLFVHRSPDLCKINNLDGYLRRLMYNLFKSQKRRAAFRSVKEFSIDSYDSIEYVLPEVADRCHNPHLLLQTQDALRAICEYACFRKERLKIGSALILRFFHGYHTSEIAQIMGVTPSAVSHQLKLAQNEVSLYFNDPTNANFCHDIASARSEYGLKYGCLVDDLVEELRRAIFLSSSCDGCILYFDLCKLYGAQRKEEIDCKTLAHIVSCANCLSAVSAILELDLPTIRHPIDKLTRYANTKDRRALQWSVTERGPVIYQNTAPAMCVSYGD